MIEKKVAITTEYIKLQDLLKFANVVSSGSDAKYLILEGNVALENETVTQRGKKVYPGMTVECRYDDHYRIIVEK